MPSSPPRGARLPKRRKTIEVDMAWVEILDEAKKEKASLKPPPKKSVRPPAKKSVKPPPLSQGAHRRHTTEVELSCLEPDGDKPAPKAEEPKKKKVARIPREDPEE